MILGIRITDPSKLDASSPVKITRMDAIARAFYEEYGSCPGSELTESLSVEVDTLYFLRCAIEELEEHKVRNADYPLAIIELDKAITNIGVLISRQEAISESAATEAVDAAISGGARSDAASMPALVTPPPTVNPEKKDVRLLGTTNAKSNICTIL